jgi:hypothetical protein
MQVFLVISTCFLYLVAAGLFSRAVWYFEAQKWNDLTGGDAAETGSGPGSYDITKSVWHINVCPSSIPPNLNSPLTRLSSSATQSSTAVADGVSSMAF